MIGADSREWQPDLLQVASTPKLCCVKPLRASAALAHLFHHVFGASRPIAALAVPQADEIDLVGAEPQGGVHHPAVVALVRIFALLRRTKLARRHKEDAARLGGEETRAPIAAGEVDGFFQK